MYMYVHVRIHVYIVQCAFSDDNVHHCTNSAAFSDVVYKHDNALYPGPQPIPPAPFDPDHCRHEIADFYRHHIRPPGEPILIPLLQNTHSISHHYPRYLSLSLLHRLSLLLHNNSNIWVKGQMLHYCTEKEGGPHC